MKKMIKNIVILLLILLIFGNCMESESDVKTDNIVGQTEKIEDSIRSLELKFKLINDTAELLAYDTSDNQFRGLVELININHETLDVYQQFYYGLKGSVEAFYLEAFDMDNNEIDIRRPVDYQYFYDSNRISLDPGDTIRDTMHSDFLYEFKNIGQYKIRSIFDLKYNSYESDSVTGKVYSNWDTITIIKNKENTTQHKNKSH
jgi:hypothetical protein